MNNIQSWIFFRARALGRERTFAVFREVCQALQIVKRFRDRDNVRRLFLPPPVTYESPYMRVKKRGKSSWLSRN
jgi:hypothetical protein